MRSAPFALAILLASGSARAEEPAPSTGTFWLVGGSIATATGVANLAGTPLCFVTSLPQAQRMPCGVTSLAFGLVGVGVGVPLLVVGAEKRAMWLRQVHAVPNRDGAAVVWGGQF